GTPGARSWLPNDSCPCAGAVAGACLAREPLRRAARCRACGGRVVAVEGAWRAGALTALPPAGILQHGAHALDQPAPCRIATQLVQAMLQIDAQRRIVVVPIRPADLLRRQAGGRGL